MSPGFVRYLLLFVTMATLFLGGGFLLDKGDGPSNWPTYHAGTLMLYSVLVVACIYVPIKFFALSQPVNRIFQFVGWILVGTVGLCFIELLSRPGDCCANPSIRMVITTFTLVWKGLLMIYRGVTCR